MVWAEFLNSTKNGMSLYMWKQQWLLPFYQLCVRCKYYLILKNMSSSMKRMAELTLGIKNLHQEASERAMQEKSC